MVLKTSPRRQAARRGQTVLEVLISVVIALTLWGVVLMMNRTQAHMATSVDEHVSRASELSRLLRTLRRDVDRVPRIGQADRVRIEDGGWSLRLPVQEETITVDDGRVRAGVRWVTYRFDRTEHVLVRDDGIEPRRIDLEGVETLEFAKRPPVVRGGRRQIRLTVVHAAGTHREARTFQGMLPYGPAESRGTRWVSILTPTDS